MTTATLSPLVGSGYSRVSGLLQDAIQGLQWQADHVAVRATDAFYQPRPLSLHTVPSRRAGPLAGLKVRPQLVAAQRPHLYSALHTGLADRAVLGIEHAQTADHPMLAAGQAPQVAGRLTGVDRLAEDGAVDMDAGVTAQHQRPPHARPDPLRERGDALQALADRERLGTRKPDRIRVRPGHFRRRRWRFLDPARDRDERQAFRAEQRAAALRPGSQDDHPRRHRTPAILTPQEPRRRQPLLAHPNLAGRLPSLPLTRQSGRLRACPCPVPCPRSSHARRAIWKRASTVRRRTSPAR